MSHFLERLASGVTKSAGTASQPALHPLLGSVYAPAWSGAAGGQASAQEAETARTSASDESDGAERATTVGRSTRATLRGGSVVSRESTTHANSELARPGEIVLPQASARMETLLPLETVETRSAGFADAAGEKHDDLLRSGDGRDSAQSTKSEKGADRAEISGVDEPLMPASQPGRSSLVRPLVEQASSGKASTANGEHAPRAGHAAHEPDEIAIHIGRIEVAAVQQPVVRPAAAPARRSISLDEYLKRGNGRAR